MLGRCVVGGHGRVRSIRFRGPSRDRLSCPIIVVTVRLHFFLREQSGFIVGLGWIPGKEKKGIKQGTIVFPLQRTGHFPSLAYEDMIVVA